MGFPRARVLAQLLEWYGVEVSPTLISSAHRGGDGRGAEVGRTGLWRICIPSGMWTDGRIKVRENQRILTKAVYLVLGVPLEGQKELLGMWISENEGARILALGLY